MRGFVGEGAVAFNDAERREHQIRSRAAERSSEEEQADRERREAAGCYLLAVALILATPFHSCDEAGQPSRYLVNHKWWILIYMSVACASLLRDKLLHLVDRWYAEHRITHRRRQWLKLLLTFGFEVLHLGW